MPARPRPPRRAPRPRPTPAPRLAAALLALALALAPASTARAQRLAGSGPLASVPAPVLLDTTGRFRAAAARVGDDVFVTGQPTEQALRELREQGVTTVVNLRTPEEMRTAVPYDEEALAARLGMRYVALPVRGDTLHPYTPATVARFAEELRRADGKVLLHCTIAWRASHLWAAYLVAERALPLEMALDHARQINLLGWRREGAPRQPVEDFLGRTLPTLARPVP